MTAALASSDYQDLLAEADESSIGVPIDNITEIVAGTLPTVPTPVASVVQAVAAPFDHVLGSERGRARGELARRTFHLRSLAGR